MKLLADECVYKETIDFLKKKKFKVVSAREKGIEASLDKEVLDFYRKNDYTLLT